MYRFRWSVLLISIVLLAALGCSSTDSKKKEDNKSSIKSGPSRQLSPLLKNDAPPENWLEALSRTFEWGNRRENNNSKQATQLFLSYYFAVEEGKDRFKQQASEDQQQLKGIRAFLDEIENRRNLWAYILERSKRLRQSAVEPVGELKEPDIRALTDLVLAEYIRMNVLGTLDKKLDGYYREQIAWDDKSKTLIHMILAMISAQRYARALEKQSKSKWIQEKLFSGFEEVLSNWKNKLEVFHQKIQNRKNVLLISEEIRQKFLKILRTERRKTNQKKDENVSENPLKIPHEATLNSSNDELLSDFRNSYVRASESMLANHEHLALSKYMRSLLYYTHYRLLQLPHVEKGDDKQASEKIQIQFLSRILDGIDRIWSW